MLDVAAVSVEHLCGAHWHVAHVRWAGPAGECVALSTACCSFAYGKKNRHDAPERREAMKRYREMY